MKALIKGGLCLALGWLANDAAAQDEVRWQAFTPKNNSPIAVLSPSVNANTSRPAVIPLDTAIRPVSLTETVPLESNTDYGTKTGSGRVVLGSSLPMVVRGQVVRGQAGDNSVIPPLPTVGGTKEVIPIPPPRTMPNDDRGFIAPQPAPYSIIPMPADSVWNSMSAPGEGPSTGLNEGCCSPKLGSMFGGNGGCCPDRSRFWMSGEYLMWWQRSDSVPPLVTTSPLPFVDGQSGVLGGPNTQILYNSFPNHTRGGARFDAGMWLDRSSNWGVEANFLFLGREDDIATFSSNGNPLLFRPFYSVNPLTGTVTPAVEDVANPFAKVVPVVGSVTVDHFSQLWGIEGNVRYKWRCGSNYWIDILAGYRHLNLSEGVDITENLTPTDGNPLAPRIVQDSFHTRNQFNGAQVGLDSEWRWNRFFLGATGSSPWEALTKSSISMAARPSSRPTRSPSREGCTHCRPTSAVIRRRDSRSCPRSG